MKSFAILFILALIVFMLFAAGLCIGLILTGKTRIKRGTCGYDPTQKPDTDCEGKQKDCPICSASPQITTEKNT